ncbi:MAG: response regulator [Cyanobacteria bacterium P01_A01_bin.37]
MGIDSTHRDRILIVDDQPDNLRLLSSMLTSEGYDVRRAMSGTLALRNVQTNPPDLILLDINMPELSGYDVCQTLKADLHSRGIPIIFLSASNSEHDKVKAFEVGGVDYITKPFQVREVLARVAMQLKLQTLNQLRENLSRMLVHDLRSPLSFITFSSSALLSKSYIEPEDQETLQHIYTMTQRLSHMLNDLLVAAKLDAGKLVLQQTPVDLNVLITEAMSAFTFESTIKQVSLMPKLPESPHELSLDANLFRRVLENLIANAIKFSPMNGTVMIELTHQHQSNSDCPKTVIRISDQGMGVPDDKRQDIFKPYEIGQSVDGISQIGLGLSFCKIVVDAHDGNIFVEENQPTGAIFNVILN